MCYNSITKVQLTLKLKDMKKEEEKIPAGSSPERPRPEQESKRPIEKETREQTSESPETQKKEEKEEGETPAAERMEREGGEAGEQPSAESKEREEEIEDILEEDIAEYYSELGEKEKEGFKQEGEKLTQEISRMINRRNPDPNYLNKRIRKWLSRLDVDKNFLSQEVKKKTDDILALRDPSE